MAETEHPQEVERPYRYNRRQHLKYLIKRNKTAKALAGKLGMEPGNLSNIVKGRRDLGDELATRCERLAGMHLGWMDEPLTPAELQAIGEAEAEVIHFPMPANEPAAVESLFQTVAVMCTPLDKTGREMVAAALGGSALNPETAPLQAARAAGVIGVIEPGKRRQA